VPDATTLSKLLIEAVHSSAAKGYHRAGAARTAVTKRGGVAAAA